ITDRSSHWISRWTYNHLIEWGVSHQWAAYVNLAVLLTAVVILVYFLQYTVRTILKTILQRVASSSSLRLFGYLYNNRLPHFLALIAPFSLVKNAIPVVFSDFPGWIKPLDAATEVYMVFMLVWMLM